jgi:hypothetical protein
MAAWMVVKSQPEAHTVSVAGRGVGVGGMGVGVGGMGVAVGVGAAVEVGVCVGGMEVAVGAGVSVGGDRVAIGATGVAAGEAFCPQPLSATIKATASSETDLFIFCSPLLPYTCPSDLGPHLSNNQDLLLSLLAWSIVPHSTTFQNIDLRVPVWRWTDDDLVAADVAEYPDIVLGHPVKTKAPTTPPFKLYWRVKAPCQVLIVGDYLLHRVVSAILPFVAIYTRRAQLT